MGLRTPVPVGDGSSDLTRPGARSPSPASAPRARPVVAALTALLAGVIVALAAERLAPSDVAVTRSDVRAAPPAAPRAPPAGLRAGTRSRPRRPRRVARVARRRTAPRRRRCLGDGAAGRRHRPRGRALPPAGAGVARRADGVAARVGRAWAAGRVSREPPPGAAAQRGSVYVRDGEASSTSASRTSRAASSSS